jgi:hypothetical protein
VKFPLKRVRPVVWAVLLVSLTSSCQDDPLGPIDGSGPEAEPGPSARMLGLVEVTLSGLGTGDLSASVAPVSLETGLPLRSPDGVLLDLNPLPTGAAGGIQLEVVSSGSFTEGTRSQGGQRYMYATFRVRNASADGVAYADPRTNLTLIAVGTAGTIAGTPISRIHRFDGSTADSSIATSVVPTGAVFLDESQRMRSQFPDVLQVLEEGEIGPTALAAPAAVTERFPYGFVVRNPGTGNSRTLPASPAVSQFDGQVTFAFRVPLQPHDAGTTNGPQKDPFTLSFVFMAVDDTETRVTESIEEQTPAGRTAVAARAAALSATTVTVLNGSPAVDPAVPGYPGQRQICDVRTAGAPGSPVSRITAPGAYSDLTILWPGEAMDACAPYFRTGSPGRPATEVPFDVMVYATDRYGNIRTMVSDTVRLSSIGSAPPATMPAPGALTSGERAFTLTYRDYGADSLTATGRRLAGQRLVRIDGVTRVWTGAESTDWYDRNNWLLGAVPMSQDSVIIPNPATGARFPALTANASIRGLVVEDGATLSLGSRYLTAAGSVTTGTSGGIDGGDGRLILSGTAQTLRGVVPRLRVIGTYTLTGNLTVRAPFDVERGRLTNASFRVTATTY